MCAKIKGVDRFIDKSETKWVFDELTKTDTLTIGRNLCVDIVGKQDELIMRAIHTIGGDTYEHITVDKKKVLAALGKSVAKKPVAKSSLGTLVFKCPVCRKSAYIPKIHFVDKKPPNYCSECGQALDWR